MSEKPETKSETSGRVRLERVVRPLAWVPCALPPEEGVPVWLWDGQRLWIGAREYCNDDPGGWFYGMGYGLSWNSFHGKHELSDNEWDDDYQPTHWMPLPEPPAV